MVHGQVTVALDFLGFSSDHCIFYVSLDHKIFKHQETTIYLYYYFFNLYSKKIMEAETMYQKFVKWLLNTKYVITTPNAMVSLKGHSRENECGL